MAYECLTGEVPFRRPGEFEVLFAHLNDEPPPPSAAGAQLPAELDTVVARAMAKDADERPAERHRVRRRRSWGADTA